MSRSSDLLAALSRAYNLTETHGLDDPTVRDALLDVRDAAAGGTPVEVEVFRDGLGVAGADPGEGRIPGVLAQDLASLGVTGMTIPADVGAAHLERFLGALRDAAEGGGVTLSFGGGDAASPEAGRSVASLYGEEGGEAATTVPEGKTPAEAAGGRGRDRDVMDLVVSLAADEETAGEETAGEEAAPEEREALAEAEAVAGGEVDALGEAEAEAVAEREAEAMAEIEAEAMAEMEAEGEAEGLDPEEGEEVADPVAERIEELLDAYREASPAEEEAAADAIREEAERFREQGELDALARLIEELILAAEEGDAPEEAVDLAREFAGHGVMARIAIHLGAARLEERREALTTVACRLGRSMASTIADALTDAPDRSARRTYMEALENMGADALEIAESMASDSRWFIARNGVSLLGELGDQSAIQHLTTPLAHSDPRLRKETVLALAKLGGEDAGNLCVGMLGDSDSDVRASAAMAVGVLKVEKARRQLMSRLEDEQDPDVQGELMKALGQLGDPSAVPAIEKRAVGGLFSRGPTEVRIAAYRALASIGTPHALALLEQATEDKDPQVRSVARSLVQRRERAGVAAEAEAEAGREAGLEELEAEAEAEDELELE